MKKSFYILLAGFFFTACNTLSNPANHHENSIGGNTRTYTAQTFDVNGVMSMSKIDTVSINSKKASNSLDGNYDHNMAHINSFVKNVNVPITTPAGTFKCTEYEKDIVMRPETTLSGKVLIFESPSVGVVQKEYYEVDPHSDKLFCSIRTQLLSTK